MCIKLQGLTFADLILWFKYLSCAFLVYLGQIFVYVLF